MKFCDECGNKLTRSVETGEVLFMCVCMKSFKGEARDTLLLEENFETHKSNLKYDTFIENSAHDDTNKRILRNCKLCERNYMTLIRIGEQSKVMFTCICGARETADGVVIDGSVDGSAANGGDSGNDSDTLNLTDMLEDVDGDSDSDDSSGSTADNIITGSSQVFKCDLASKWFDELKNGKKTSLAISSTVSVGDIIFVRSDHANDTIKLLVQSATKYMSLKDYLEAAGVPTVLPGVAELEDALEILEKEFDPVQVHRDGIYGVTFMAPDYVMRMNAPWLDGVVAGKKTIDVRSGGGRFDKWNKGDVVVVFNDDEHVITEVVSVRHYKTMAQLLKAESIENIFPGITAADKAKQILSQWHKPAQIRKNGLVAVEFKLRD